MSLRLFKGNDYDAGRGRRNVASLAIADFRLTIDEYEGFEQSDQLAFPVVVSRPVSSGGA